MRIVFLLGLALGVVSALGAPAHAGRDVGVVVAGESWMQPQLVSQIEAWLGQHGHAVVPLPADARDALKQCFVGSSDLGCARGVVEQRAGAPGVIYARLDARGDTAGTPDVTLTAYWLDRGHDPVAERKTCPRCTDQNLRATADAVLKKLVGGDDPGHVKLKSAPPGARISIDGQAIGITPLDWDLPAGKHTIQMDKPGLRPASRDVTVVSNQSELIVVTLTTDGGGDDADGAGLPRWVPLAATITGGAAVVGGIAMIAFSPGPDDRQRYYTSTRAPGIGVAIGGAVMGGLGAYWLFFRSPHADSAPVASVTGDGAYLGWLGSF